MQFYPENPVVGDTVQISLTQNYGQNATYHWYFGDSDDTLSILLVSENQLINNTNYVNHIYKKTGISTVHVEIMDESDTTMYSRNIFVDRENKTCNCLNTASCAYAQNGSFECKTNEPHAAHQIDYACPWLTTSSGADLYSTGAPSTSPYNFQIPESHFGYQYPFNTNSNEQTGYAGFYAEDYKNGTSTMWKRREYLYQKLKQPLIQGMTYHVSMRVSLAEGSTISCPVGIYLTSEDPVLHSFPGYNAFYYNVPNSTHSGHLIQSPNYITSTDWVEISGDITPTTSDIEYIIISKFNDESCLDYDSHIPDLNYYPVLYGPSQDIYELAYYFVDNVNIELVSIPDFEISGYNNSCTQESQYSSSITNSSLMYTWEILPSNLNYGSFLSSSSGLGLTSVAINWNDATFPAWDDFVTLKLTISDGCTEKSAQFMVYKCCHVENPQYVFNNYTIPANTTITVSPNSVVEVNGILNVNGDLIFLTTSNGTTDVSMGRLAKVNILPGGSITVGQRAIFKPGCDYMWDGIYAEDPDSRIFFEGISEVKGAVNGLVSANGGRIHAQRITFSDNFNSVIIKNYYDNHPQYYGPLDVELSGNAFWNNINASGSGILNMRPCEGILPNCAIFVSKAIARIGIENENGNEFQNHQRGIYSVNSSVEVINAAFGNIPRPADLIYSWPFKQAAILSIGSQSETVISPSLTASNSTHGLVFTGCSVGISTQNTRALVNSGIFTDCKMPIHILNPSFPTDISGNTILRGNQNPVYDITGTGISVISANPTTSDAVSKVLIKDNSITGMRTGIHCVNQNATVSFYPTENQVALNEIHFTAPCLSDNYRSGIRIEGCDGINVFDNIVDYDGWIPDEQQRHRGLSIKKSQGTFVSENYFTNLDAGVFTNGELQKTLFFCNTFDHCWNGFYFGEETAMTDQVFNHNGEKFCTNNRWIGDYGPIGNQYQMTQNTTGSSNLVDPFRWYFDAVTTDPEYLLDPELFGVGQHPCYQYVSPQPEFDDFSICDMDNYGMDSTNPPMDSIRRAQLFRDMLMGLIEYDTLIPQNRFYEKDYVFIYLLNHPEALNLGASDDEEYQEFIDSITDTDVDLIHQVYRCMQNSKLDSAALINDGLSGNEIWTANRKTVNTYYMQYWAGGEYDISEDDSLNLLSIALQTPYAGGDAVYTARCLLNLFDVETMGTAYSALITQSIMPKLRVWPNPANTEISIELPGELPDLLTIEFYSPDGRLIEQNYHQIKGNILIIRTSNIQDGYYFIQVKSGETIIGVQKVCVMH